MTTRQEEIENEIEEKQHAKHYNDNYCLTCSEIEVLQAKLEGIKIGEQNKEIEIAELRNAFNMQLDCNVKLIEQKKQAEQKAQALWGEIKRYLDMPSKTWDRIKEKYNLK